MATARNVIVISSSEEEIIALRRPKRRMRKVKSNTTRDLKFEKSSSSSDNEVHPKTSQKNLDKSKVKNPVIPASKQMRQSRSLKDISNSPSKVTEEPIPNDDVFSRAAKPLEIEEATNADKDRFGSKVKIGRIAEGVKASNEASKIASDETKGVYSKTKLRVRNKNQPAHSASAHAAANSENGGYYAPKIPSKKRNAGDRSKLGNTDVASTSKKLSSPSALNAGDTTLDYALECECCFCPYDFEYMVQCLSGHLFCCYCLERYAKESVYGQGKVNLLCMTSNCGATFLRSQIERTLPDYLVAKFDERVQEEAINMAGLADFYKCKECNTGATLDPEVKYFRCPNAQCQQVFCRLCEVDYKDHLGLACKEIEKEEETDIRKNFEEKMSEAKIRICHACKFKYTKEPNTCNKITCRCQRTMCYICRTPDIDYKHFCQDVRDPGLPCSKCNKCFLWSHADEDDELAINEIKNEARKARAEKGYNEKTIGVPIDQKNQHHKKYQRQQYPGMNLAPPQGEVDNLGVAYPAPRRQRQRIPPPVLAPSPVRARIPPNPQPRARNPPRLAIRALNPPRFPVRLQNPARRPVRAPIIPRIQDRALNPGQNIEAADVAPRFPNH